MKYVFILALFALLGCLLGGEAIPAASAADWASNATDAAKANADGAAATAATAGGFNWLAWLAGAGGLIVALGKFLPGVGGIVASVAGPIYDMVVHKNVRLAEAKQARLAEGFMTIVGVLDKLPREGTVGDVKRKLADRLPSDCRDAVNRWIEQQEQATT